jgi:hypothetical protein
LYVSELTDSKASGTGNVRHASENGDYNISDRHIPYSLNKSQINK